MTTEHQKHVHYTTTSSIGSWPVETAVARKVLGSLADLQYDHRTSEACPQHDNLKASVGPAGGDYPVAMELFGSLEDLQRTAAFEQGTGVSI